MYPCLRRLFLEKRLLEAEKDRGQVGLELEHRQDRVVLHSPDPAGERPDGMCPDLEAGLHLSPPERGGDWPSGEGPDAVGHHDELAAP